MSYHPDSLGRIASQHHHAMIAEASQRHLLRDARPAPRTSNIAAAIARRLTAAIAKVSIPATRVPDAS
jgi:hypothetical protein